MYSEKNHNHFVVNKGAQVNMEICYLPKIGSNGLALSKKYYNGKWGFSRKVSNFMKKYEISECWFQTFSNGDWDWFHGIVRLENDKAVIKQIG